MRDRRQNRRSKKLLIVAALGPICAAAADLPVREVTSQAQRVGGVPVPAFQRGYMYFLDRATIRLYAPQGYPAFVRVLNVPGATELSSDSLAVDSDGSVAVAISYRRAKAGGIVLLDGNGLDTGYIDTGAFLPSNLSFGEDHSLWAFGAQYGGQDYFMVRHYGADHKETGNYLARSLFPKGLEPGMPSWQRQRVMVSHDKVGLLAYSGNVGSALEWVELDLQGNLLRRVPITEKDITEYGFTSDSRLYSKDQRSDRVSVLSTTTPDWLDAGPTPVRHLVGADGDLLVFSRGGEGPVDLQWFAQPTSKGP